MIVLSLFNGISGARLACERAGLVVDKYYSSEIDKYAIQVTEKNYPDTIELGDVKNFREWDIEQPDLIVAGFPCQPYSIAGKRKGLEDERGGDIVDAMFGAIARFNPENILMENVKGLLSIDKGNTFKEIVKELNVLGYAVDWEVINSSRVSAQNRERIFIISRRINVCNNYFECSIDNKNKKREVGLFDDLKVITWDSEVAQSEDKGILLRDIIESNPDEKFNFSQKAIQGLISHKERHKKAGNGHGFMKIVPEGKANTIRARSYKDGSENVLALKNTGCIQIGKADLNGHDYIKRVYSPEGKSPNLCTGTEGNHEPKIVVPGFEKNKSEKIQKRIKNNICDLEGKGNCMLATLYKGAANNGATVISTDNLYWRKLTPLECERLQTYPDNYTEGVSNTQRYKALGNSFTVDVIAHILSQMPL